MGQFDFRKIQLGQEAGCGGAVAATSILHGEISAERRSSLVRRAPIGILANYGRQFLTQQVVGLKYTGDLTVEQVLHLLQMGVRVVAAGGGPPYPWTYTKATTAELPLKCYTVEYGDDTGAFEVNGVVAERLEFSGMLGGGEPTIMAADLFGWTKTPSVFSPGAVEPVGGVTPLPANYTRLWVNNTWGTLGTSEWTAELLAWKLTLPCAYPTWRGTNLYPTTYGIESTHATLELKLEHTANIITQIAGIEPGTPRFVRIRVRLDANHIFQFDISVTWDPETCYDADRGDNLVNLVGQSRYDFLGTKELEFVVTNLINVVP